MQTIQIVRAGQDAAGSSAAQRRATSACTRSDNVAIVVNDGGLPAGAPFPSTAWCCARRVPQGHKVALARHRRGRAGDRATTSPSATPRATSPAGSWVDEQQPAHARGARLTGLPIATRAARRWPPLEGYTFEGFRNADGSVGTRNILAITTTVQCVSGVVEYAVKRIKDELLPRYPNVDDVVGLEHTYGCGVAIDAPDADDPDPHAAQHQPEPELRRPGHGRQPRLREAAAGAPAPAGLDPDPAARQRAGHRVPAGSGARRLHGDDRRDHDHGRRAPGTPQRAPARDLSRRPTWWWACSAAAATRSPA